MYLCHFLFNIYLEARLVTYLIFCYINKFETFHYIKNIATDIIFGYTKLKLISLVNQNRIKKLLESSKRKELINYLSIRTAWSIA